MTVDEAISLVEAGHFGPGSMLPKVLAMIDYVRNGGSLGIITDVPNLHGAVSGQAGTRFVVG